MGPSTPTRISLLTALAAGGAIITCPAVTAAALGGAALTALSSIASSTLGEEVYQHFAQHRPKSLHNHHLQQLAGNALADLIDFYEKQNADPNYVQRKLPVFRRKDAELTALAHAARQHWHALDLTGDSEPAADHRLHEAFTHHDRTTEDPYIPDDEWAAHLATLEPLAHKHRQGYVTLTDDRRQALAAYIAPRFTSAVRELVKADFDPKHGTGGRTFIALHLDLMHAQSVTLRRLDAKSDQQIRHLQSIESGFDALRQLITNNLPPQLKGEYFDQLDGLRSELRTTRDALADRLDLVLENQELVLENQARDSRKIDRLLELAESDEDQLRERLTHEIRKEFADKLTEANNARLAAEALLDVRDVPGIEDALREQGGKAIVNALLEKAQAPDVASVELHRKIAEWAYLVGEIDQAFQSLQIILSHHPDDSDAINRLGHIYLLRGELPAAEQQYRQLLKISPDDKTTRATALGNLGVIAKTRGELDQAEKLHNESLQIERQLERLEGQANSLCNLGNIAHTRGELDLAEKLYNQSLQIERQLGRLEGQAIALSNLGNIAHTRGELDLAEKLYNQSLQIERQLGRLEGQANQLGNLGLIAKTRGDLDQAEKLHNESLQIERQLGRLEGQASDLGNLGLIAQTRGELDQAEKLHNESLQIERQLGRLEGQASELGNLGLIAQTRGELDRAEKLYNESLRINRQLGRLEGQAIQLGNLGVIAQTRGELDQAEELLNESLKINRQLGRLEGQANQLGNLGVIAKTRGDLDQAEKLLNESLKINRQLGRLEGQANQLGNLGVIAKTRGDLDQARSLWKQSHDLFAQASMPHMAKKVQGLIDGLDNHEK